MHGIPGSSDSCCRSMRGTIRIVLMHWLTMPVITSRPSRQRHSDTVVIITTVVSVNRASRATRAGSHEWASPCERDGRNLNCRACQTRLMDVTESKRRVTRWSRCCDNRRRARQADSLTAPTPTVSMHGTATSHATAAGRAGDEAQTWWQQHVNRPRSRPTHLRTISS